MRRGVEERAPGYLLGSLDERVAFTWYRRGNATSSRPGGRGGLVAGHKGTLAEQTLDKHFVAEESTPTVRRCLGLTV